MEITRMEMSKQYTELYDHDIKGDFDIIKEFGKLKEGTYINIICEGFGFIAIGKSPNEPNPKLLFRFEQAIKEGYWEEIIPTGLNEQDCVWIDYYKVIPNKQEIEK